MDTAKQEWRAAYSWQRRARGSFVMCENLRIRDHLRRLFAEPYLIHGRMASGRPATMLNYRWRDMRPVSSVEG